MDGCTTDGRTTDVPTFRHLLGIFFVRNTQQYVGQTDRHTDLQRETIIPRNYHVAGYNNTDTDKYLYNLLAACTDKYLYNLLATRPSPVNKNKGYYQI